MRLILDIHSKKPWPSNQLSNFAEAPFTLDGLRFTCMESFLQSLKDPLNQEDYQSLTAREAKERGSKIKWQRTGYLYWRGEAFRRNNWPIYRALLIRAYDAMFEANPAAVDALLQTGHCILWHSVGRWSRHRTCLTTFEFLYLLYRARRIQHRNQKREVYSG